MRFFLIVLCLLAMIATGWHAIFKGTPYKNMRGAPQIEAMVRDGATALVDAAADAPVAVSASGRTVILTGLVHREEDRQAVIGASGQTYLATRIVDQLSLVEIANPFVLQAEKSADGSLKIYGHVPGETAEAAILAHAKTVGNAAAISADLQIAGGVPDGDWTRFVTSGLTGLSHLNQGQLILHGRTGHLEGEAPDKAARDAALDAIISAPMGPWSQDIRGAPPDGGFLFSAMKMPGGGIAINGHAPDEETRDRIIAAAEAGSADELEGSLEIATGMPDLDWPDRVTASLAALGLATTGTLSVDGSAVSIKADVDTDEDRAEMAALIDPEWSADISVLNPSPAGDATFTLSGDGTVSASGLLPDGVTAADLERLLPDLDASAISGVTEGKSADWTAPMEGLSIVLPRFETASARIVSNRIGLDGVLRRGYSADGVEASLRTALDRGWTIALDVTEQAPLAELMLSKRDGEIVLSGVLPEGISPEAALDLLGDSASGEGLAGGGDGDAASWQAGLEAAGGAFSLFDTVTGRIADGSLELNGVLRPGYGTGDVQSWLEARLGDGWTASLRSEETAANEGDRRISLATGEAENYRQGFWLPDVDFPVSPGRCKAEIDAALASEQIQFVVGSARIDSKGRALLNRLAAVSVRCLNSEVMRLQIIGHTDSVGNDDRNLRLSQDRADAVLGALAERGVRQDAMESLGMGEADPVASNNTADGRSQNRRIEFVWIENNG